MKSVFTFCIFICLAAPVFFPPLLSGADRTCEITLQFAAPGTNPQDLTWDGQHLWNVDDDTDTIYKLDPLNGNVLLSYSSPGSSPRGLVFDGTYLWNSDESTHKIYKMIPETGQVITMIDVPTLDINGEPSPLGGLAWYSGFLWSSFKAGWSSRMNQVDPSGGSVTKYYFTKGIPCALTSSGSYLWSGGDEMGLGQGTVYKYDISNGLYISHFDTPGSYPTGLAYDSPFMWVVDKETLTIYKLTIE